MGKSPGKWIKTLFGKKPSKSQVTKKYTNDKEWSGGKTSLGLDSPVISQPMPVNDSGNGILLESEMGSRSCLPTDGVELLPMNDDIEKQANAVSDGANDPEKAKLERAAVMAQAAFRGYLARRAFRALRGIIRLQAVVRGHLVRRQAVVTFQCIIGIVKLQALVRGQKVRLSNEGDANLYRAISVTAKHLDPSSVGIPSLKMKFRDHTFIFKLLSGTPIAMPLQMQYVDGEPNSLWNWLERWTLARFWKPLSKPKKAVNLKTQGKHGTFTIETESGRPKRSVRRNFSSNSEHGNANAVVESEKAKRNPRKYPSSHTEGTQENPQTELEKVKRGLRKITNPTTVTSDQADEETEKPKHNARRVSNPLADNKKERIEKDVALPLATEGKPSLENGSKPEQDAEPDAAIDPIPVEANNSSDGDNVSSDSLPLQGIILDENCTLLNEDLMSKENNSHENQKTSRRRTSFSSKSDYPENTLQDTPKLPSYMAATESAKAKLRGQTSPRFSSDAVEKNGFTRRHSLPASTNGKLSSQSPRVQRISQTSGGKGGIKTDRFISSSRDDKPIQVEWRR